MRQQSSDPAPMNIPRLFLLSLFVCLAFVSPVVAKDTPEATKARHTAWKIQGDKCTVYLLGSLHMLKGENYPLPPVFERAFTNASIVVFETDLGEVDHETKLKLMSKFRLPEGRTLKDELSEKNYKAFMSRLQSNALPEMIFAQLPPGIAARQLAMFELEVNGFSTENGIDLHFYKRTKADGKAVRSLESLDFQLSLLCNLSKDEGEAFFKSTMDGLNGADTAFAKLVNAWTTGDKRTLEKLVNEESKRHPPS